MFGSSVLDVGIGLILVYLIVSLVCTAANETLASLFHWRAENLRAGIRNLLDGSTAPGGEWARRLYEHPLIQGLYEPGQAPSYIPSRTFALALTDLLLPSDVHGPAVTAQQLRSAIDAAPCGPRLRQVMRVLLDEAERSSAAGQKLRLEGVLDIQKLDTLLNQFHLHIEIWFNNVMERVSGWYKRSVQAWTLGIALVLTIGMNVDSVLIARHLARDAALRSALVAQAEQMVQQPAAGPDSAARGQLLQDRLQELKAVGIPFGWPDPDAGTRNASWLLLKVLGILMTAGAASLGAPFWFDVLNRIISVRSAGKAPEEMPKPPRQIPIPAAPGQPEGGMPPGDSAAKP